MFETSAQARVNRAIRDAHSLRGQALRDVWKSLFG